ncbi:MAG: acylneuraminate cytidylyltransferase family protein [Rhodospirillaceae bacterium]
MRLAVIPARGGSKRIPRKNLTPIGGRPMVAHAIGLAEASDLFDAICVSTDDDEVAAVAAAAGHPPPFRRPAELADDHAPLLPVLDHACRHYEAAGQEVASVLLLYPCTPLLTVDDLRAAHDVFVRQGGARTVLSVVESKPVQRAMLLTGEGILEPVSPGAFQARTQDQKKAYFDAGAFAFFPRHKVSATLAGGDQGQVAYVLPRWRAADIDEPADLELVELLYKALVANE